MPALDFSETQGKCIFCGDADILENGYCYSCNDTAEEMGFDIEDLAL